MASFEHFPQRYPESASDIEKNQERIDIHTPLTETDLEKLSEGDEDLEKLKEQLIDYTQRYTEDVYSMKELLAQGLDSDEAAQRFAEADEARTRLHNAMIDSVNIFSRTLAKKGRDNSWMREVALSPEDRAGYGRFALALTHHRYLSYLQEQQDEQNESS